MKKRLVIECVLVILGMLLFGVGLASAGVSEVKAKAFHVAVNGDDGNAGSRVSPFGSIERARDAVRGYKSKHPTGDITVWIHGGTYQLKETLVFSLADSGNLNQRITYAAWPGEEPILSGSARVTGWKLLDHAPKDLPRVAQGKVWVADVSQLRQMKAKQKKSPSVASQMDRVARFFTLYQGRGQLPRARGEKFFLVKNSKRRRKISDNSYTPFLKNHMADWADISEGELMLIPDRSWVYNILPIEKIDLKRKRLITAVPGTYNLSRTRTHVQVPNTQIQNVLGLLDKPGEWMVDRRTNRLYLWPKNLVAGKPSDDIQVPVLTELIRVQGKTDYRGAKDTPVEYLTFKGLTFIHGDRIAWQGMTGWGVQHDWERFDTASAMLRFRGAENCAVEDCQFLDAGASGLRLDLHAQRNRIIGNKFHRLGGVGILLAGYGPGTKDVNRNNIVSNNHISHIGQLYAGSPAIFVWQSGGNRIDHNLIHDTPYVALVVTGRISWSKDGKAQCSRTVRWADVKQAGWTPSNLPKSWTTREKYLHARNNLVLRNEIHHVMQVCCDGNAIYVSGAGGGNRVIENYCHDSPSRHMNSAIRCDNDQHGTTIERNIIFRTGGDAEGFMSKGNNTIRQNLVIDLRSNSGRHRGYLRFFSGDIHGSIIEGNIFYSRDAKQTIIADGKPRGGKPATRFRQAHADYNLYFNEQLPHWGLEILTTHQKLGIEQHSIIADPMFVDIDKQNFQFRKGSPALKLGIAQPIQIKKIGLQGKYRRK